MYGWKCMVAHTSMCASECVSVWASERVFVFVCMKQCFACFFYVFMQIVQQFSVCEYVSTSDCVVILTVPHYEKKKQKWIQRYHEMNIALFTT